MTYEGHLIKVYENLIYERAKSLVGKITDKVICHLKNVKDVSSFGRNELIIGNLWEDIALREQLVISNDLADWSECDSVICSYIKSIVNDICTETDKVMIWLQTEQAEEWNKELYYAESDVKNLICDERLPVHYKLDDVVDYIYSRVKSEAVNYRNDSIEAFRYGGEELD